MLCSRTSGSQEEMCVGEAEGLVANIRARQRRQVRNAQSLGFSLPAKRSSRISRQRLDKQLLRTMRHGHHESGDSVRGYRHPEKEWFDCFLGSRVGDAATANSISGNGQTEDSARRLKPRAREPARQQRSEKGRCVEFCGGLATLLRRFRTAGASHLASAPIDIDLRDH